MFGDNGKILLYDLGSINLQKMRKNQTKAGSGASFRISIALFKIYSNKFL